jgi:iron complex outermembrane receptor protein
MSQSLRSVAAVLAAILATSGVPAAESESDNASTELGTVEVIGQRIPAALPVTTDIITAAMLARLHRDDLAQALELVPGLASQNVGQRRERLLTLRGFNSRQVPLFIDGVPVYVPYDGNVDLARFGVDYVSEIRVGKGLASLLYGPNIMGGAINVVSRRPTEPLSVSARLASEHDDQLDSNLVRGALALAAAGDRWYGSFSFSRSESDGYRLPDAFEPLANREDGGRRDNAESRDQLFVARVGFTPDEDSEYGFTWYRQEGRKDSPPYAGTSGPSRFWDWPYWNKESFSLASRNAVAEQGTLRLRAYYDKFGNALEAFTNLAETTWMFRGSSYDDYAKGAGADFEWRWSYATATRLAAHYKKDVHRDIQELPSVPRQQLVASTWDFAIEQEWRVSDALSMTPSYQYVYQPARTMYVWSANQYSPVAVNKSTTSNGQLVAVWEATQNGSVVGGVSRKTRFPALKDRFSGGLGSVVPNPDLKAEYANHFELGYEHRGGAWTAKLALYQANLRDAIESVTLPGTACAAPNPNCSQLQNIGRQRNRGVELSGSWQARDTLRFDAQVNLLDRDNLSSPALLPTDTPESTQRLAAAWQFLPRWRASVDAQHESKRYSATNGSRVAAAFTLVNGFVRYGHDDNWGVEVGVRNLTDELYAYQEGFFEPGRSWLLQLDWRK